MPEAALYISYIQFDVNANQSIKFQTGCFDGMHTGSTFKHSSGRSAAEVPAARSYKMTIEL
jgi:hypothetical protein